MSNAVLAVIAALGASALTAGASLGVVGLQERLRRKAGERRALAGAVTELLTRSMAVSLRAETMGEVMKIRSGLGRRAVRARARKPYDPLEIHDWMAQDLVPLHAARWVIWARGDQELIGRANNLMYSCMDLISAATALMPAETTTARMRRRVAGQRWTQEMLDKLQEARTAMAESREQLAQYARRVLRTPPVLLEAAAGAAVSGSPSPAALATGNQQS